MQNKTLWTKTSITLLEALQYNPDLLEHFDFNNANRTSMFKKIFTAHYNTKSIAGETVELFKVYIDNKFDEFVDYYNEMLNIYERELSYDDGIVVTREHVDEGDGSDSSESDSTDRFVDLPNRSTEGEYDSQRTIRNGNSSNSNEYHKEINETVKGGVNVIEQREKALKFVRNIYLEFANKFEDCFACIYA